MQLFGQTSSNLLSAHSSAGKFDSFFARRISSPISSADEAIALLKKIVEGQNERIESFNKRIESLEKTVEAQNKTIASLEKTIESHRLALSSVLPSPASDV